MVLDVDEGTCAGYQKMEIQLVSELDRSGVLRSITVSSEFEDPNRRSLALLSGDEVHRKLDLLAEIYQRVEVERAEVLSILFPDECFTNDEQRTFFEDVDGDDDVFLDDVTYVDHQSSFSIILATIEPSYSNRLFARSICDSHPSSPTA